MLRRLRYLTLHVPDGGEKAALEVDCHALIEAGVDPSQLGAGNDPVSDALIAGYATRVASEDPAVIAYEIG